MCGWNASIWCSYNDDLLRGYISVIYGLIHNAVDVAIGAWYGSYWQLEIDLINLNVAQLVAYWSTSLYQHKINVHIREICGARCVSWLNWEVVNAKTPSQLYSPLPKVYLLICNTDLSTYIQSCCVSGLSLGPKPAAVNPRQLSSQETRCSGCRQKTEHQLFDICTENTTQYCTPSCFRNGNLSPVDSTCDLLIRMGWCRKFDNRPINRRWAFWSCYAPDLDQSAISYWEEDTQTYNT